jgi:hypothetical protein
MSDVQRGIPPPDDLSIPSLRSTYRLGERIREASRRDVRARAEIICAWAISRALVLATAQLVQTTGFPKHAAGAALTSRTIGVLQTWDGRWYQTIANHGYLLLPGRQSDPAFFPLLPIVLRLCHLVGLSFSTGYLVISNLAFAVGLLALYELARTWVPEPNARRSAVYAAIFPLSFVFSMMYPEALAFALIALAGLLAARRRWGTCAACAALATLVRPEGALLVIPITAAAVTAWRSMPAAARGRAAGAVLAPFAALAGYSSYLWWSIGQPFAWTKAQEAWGRSFHVTGFYDAAISLLTAARHQQGWLFRDAAFCVVYVVCLVLARRAGVPWPWILAGVAVVFLPLASGSFTSDARFGLLALPVYTGLASLGRRRAVDITLRIVCVVLLLAGVETIVLHWP